MRYEWDPEKAASNLAKHGVAFADATTVFDDPLFISVLDDEHSVVEQRFITIGMSGSGHLLMVAHADRPGAIRIISARRATRNEERFYVEAE